MEAAGTCSEVLKVEGLEFFKHPVYQRAGGPFQYPPRHEGHGKPTHHRRAVGVGAGTRFRTLNWKGLTHASALY